MYCIVEDNGGSIIHYSFPKHNTIKKGCLILIQDLQIGRKGENEKGERSQVNYKAGLNVDKLINTMFGLSLKREEKSKEGNAKIGMCLLS